MRVNSIEMHLKRDLFHTCTSVTDSGNNERIAAPPVPQLQRCRMSE